ncbi:hypothetical protein ACNO8X_26010 [Mycobacterium sp. PDNC021]|uniref:hypothetical protein n=1 Tax=Mycobacterium sp. PDNC021 TaxID=3391399 RepID=UPI003AB1018C
MTAQVNPINEWGKVLTAAFNNLSALGQQVWADPAPILKQIIINQIGYANTVSTALGAAGNSFVTTAAALPPALRQAAQQLAAGQISGGLNTAFQALLNLVVNPGLALMQSPIFNIPGQAMQNVTNVVKLLPDVIVAAGFSVLGTVSGVQRAFGDTAQAVYDGVRAGNLGAAVNAILNAPAVLTNAFLNGYAPTGAAGILSPGFGLVPLLVVSIRQAIAQALGAPVPAAAAAASPDTGPSAVPSAALSAATVTLGAEKVTTPDAVKVAATKTAETKTTPAEPATTAPVAAASPETPSTATETKPESGTTSGSTTTPTGGTDTTSGTTAGTPGTTGEPTKPSGSTGSETGSGSTGSGSSSGASGSTGGTTTGTPGTTGGPTKPTKPTKPSGSTGNETGSGSTTTSNGGTSTTGGTKTGTPTKPTKPTKVSGSTGSQTGSGSTGSGSGASGSSSGASASGGGASHAAA